ncbi:MAG TPA: type II toxin-antitoxin system RelE/ParE family toxin [Cellvibrio sp.]|nr:type II toxin-antitoxin system RelE/ParE family toxin [Cellvibrio sp.]
MAIQIVILESAEQDLKLLRNYILKHFSVDVWRSSYTNIKQVIRNLQAFPEVGAIADELEKLNLAQYRQVLSGMNRIIYELRQETIYIHMIVDSRRDLSGLLARRLLRMS